MSNLDTTGWGADRMCFAVNSEDYDDTGNPLDKTPQMVLQSNGNVGIGTTSPVSALTIGGTTNTLSDTIITLASDGESLYKQGNPPLGYQSLS